ncbi:hypothetical protein ABPG72_015514 [Tetrahymena utriculariae]
MECCSIYNQSLYFRYCLEKLKDKDIYNIFTQQYLILEVSKNNKQISQLPYMKANPSQSPRKTFFDNNSEEIRQQTLKLIKKKLQNYDFSIKRTQDERINDCLQVMQLERDKRFKTEQMIIENATKNFPFFTKLIRKGYSRQVIECYKVITPLSLKKGDCVFYQGDISDNFYILLRGKATVITHKDQETIEKERQLLSYDEATQIQNYINQLQSEKDQMRAEISSLKNTQYNQFSISPLSVKERQLKMEQNKVRRNSLSSIGESNTPLSQSFSEYSPKKQSNKMSKMSRQQTKSKFQSKQGSTILNENDNEEESPLKTNGESYSRFSFKFLFEKTQEILNEQIQKGSTQQKTEEINLFGLNRNNSINSQDESLSPVSNVSLDSPVKIGRKTSYFLANLNDEDNPNNQKDQAKNQKLIVPELPVNLKIEDISHPQKLFQNGIYVYSNANTIKEGESFGEGGLILRRPRTATVICNSDCNFAVISRQDYDLILKEIQNKKINKKIQMLVQNMDKNIPFQTASRFCFAFFKIQLSYNQPAFQQGENPSYVYYLKKGEIEIIKNEKVQTLKKENSDLHLQDQVNQMKMFGNSKFKNRTISSISDGQFFGEEDVLDNKHERSYTARVRSSYATIYRIKAAEFRFILSQSGSVKDFFTNRMMQRQEWRASQQKKVDKTVYQLEQPKRKQTENQNNQDSNQIVSGVDDIDKIIEFCQEKQIISPKKQSDVETFSSYLDSQFKSDILIKQKNGVDSSNSIKNIKSSYKIQENTQTLASKRNQYLTSKRPLSASEIYTTSNFIMTANKNNKQYVKERGSELYSNENPIEQNLFYDNYKKKVKQRLETFQSQNSKQQKRQQSASPSQRQKTQSQSVTATFKQDETPSVKKINLKDQRRSFQEYHSKQYPQQTPKATQSLVSIKEFNVDNNIQEDEDETENLNKRKAQAFSQTLTKNMSAPLINPEQIIQNFNLVSAQQLDKEGSSVPSPSTSPRQRLNEEQNMKFNKFQINLQQSFNQQQKTLHHSHRKSETIVSNMDISPRIIVKDKFSTNSQSSLNQNPQKVNFQKRVKMQEQLRKSNRMQRSINLQKLINIQEVLFNTSTNNKKQISNLKSSFAFYFPHFSTVPLNTDQQNVNMNTNNDNNNYNNALEVKSSFDQINIPNKSANQVSLQNSSKGKTQQNQETPKQKIKQLINYQVPITFQNFKLKNQNFPSNRSIKKNSVHSQQAVNENSYRFSPNSKSNNNPPSITIQSSNFLVDEKRQLASAQIDFINKYKQFQTEKSNQRAKSANVQIENQQIKSSIQNNSQTEQINSINVQQSSFNSSQFSGKAENKFNKLQFRSKSAMLKAQTKYQNQNEVSANLKETPKVKGQKYQTIISQINMCPEFLSEQQQRNENLSSLYTQPLFDITETIQQIEQEKDKQNNYQKQILLYKKFKLNQAFENEQKSSHNLNKEAKNNFNIFQHPQINIKESDDLQLKQKIQFASSCSQFRHHDVKSPNIINIVFPLGDNTKKQKPAQHRKQNSLNMQQQKQQQHFYKIEDCQQIKFDSGLNSNQKQQQIRPLSAVDKSLLMYMQLSQKTCFNNKLMKNSPITQKIS